MEFQLEKKFYDKNGKKLVEENDYIGCWIKALLQQSITCWIMSAMTFDPVDDMGSQVK